VDVCIYCRKYHKPYVVCDEYIELLKKGKTFCYKCWCHTFTEESDCKSCGLSKPNLPREGG